MLQYSSGGINPKLNSKSVVCVCVYMRGKAFLFVLLVFFVAVGFWRVRVFGGFCGLVWFFVCLLAFRYVPW